MSGFIGGILILLFTIILFVLIPIGLIRPSVFSKWFGESIGRKGIAKYFGIAAAITMIGGGILTPTEINDITIDTVETAPIAEVLQATDTQEPEVLTETKKETETEIITFKTKEKSSDDYPNGTTQVTTKGINGVREIIFEVTYTDDKETSRKEISNKVTKEPITQITTLGTYVQLASISGFASPSPTPAPTPTPAPANCDPNYTPCVPYSAGDLNCGDISFSVIVIGVDRHRFDGDNDGYGCEGND